MQQSRHIGKLVVVMDADGAETLPIVRSSSTIGPAGTYLVTGGLSGFGLATAKWLVAQGARSLALVGRRGAANDEALAGIAALEAAGATVRAFAGDVSIAADVARILADVRAEMAPLRGVFHAAAVIEDAPILQIDAERLRRVLAPKLLGAWNLHEATLRDELDAFVLYSSSSVLVGNPGQASYVAANLYLDSLARYRRGLGLAGLSVGFGAIKDAGFLTRNAAVEELLRTRTGMDATPAAEALADLGRLLAAGATCVTVSQFNLARLGQSLSSTRAPRFRPLVPEGHSATAAGAGTMAAALEAMAEPARRTALLELVRNSVGRVLGTDGAQIELERPLGEMGLDSLMAVELAEGLEVEIGRPVSVMQLIQAGSVAAIVAAVMRGYGPATAAEPERPAAEGLSLAAV
jgi:NAD(P)-dependent dehydrogenase (short-subunit alcohol dehydrogenase family)